MLSRFSDFLNKGYPFFEKLHSNQIKLSFWHSFRHQQLAKLQKRNKLVKLVLCSFLMP